MSRVIAIVVGTLLLLVLGGCGTPRIVGEPPIVGLDELELAGSTAIVELSVRNVNAEPMPVNRVLMEIKHGPETIAHREAEPGVDLVANGTENFTVEFEAEPRLRELLQELDQQDRSSLEYILTGTVWTEEMAPLRFRAMGHLYSVPGRENHYRASGHSSSRRGFRRQERR